MSFTAELRKAEEEGRADAFLDTVGPVTFDRPTEEPVEDDITTEERMPVVIEPDVVQGMIAANEQIRLLKAEQQPSAEESKTEGYIYGALTEMTGGIGGTMLFQKYYPAMQYLRSASHVGKVGIITPEPTTTVAGLATTAAAEGLIWAGSNIMGQAVRKHYGIQDSIRGSEIIASAVFGTSFVTDKVSGLIKLARPAVGQSFKGKELLVKGRNVFVSGATLGLTESVLRQELAVLMNEAEERDEYAYIFDTLGGGVANVALNSLFHVWSRTGKWGQGQAQKIVTRATDKLKEQKAVLESKIVDPEKASRTGSILAGTKRTKPEIQASNARFLKEIQQINTAIDMAEDTLADVINASKIADIKVEKPQPLKETPSKPIKEHEAKLEELTERFKNLNSDNITQEAPKLEGELSDLYDQRKTVFSNAIRRYDKDSEDLDAVREALDEVVFLRKVDNQGKFQLETTGGRILQKAQKARDSYIQETKLSIRAIKQDAKWGDLEDSLRKRLQVGEDEGIVDIYKDLLKIKPQLKAEGKKFRKAIQKKKPKKPLTEQQELEQAEKVTNKKVENLEKELEKLRAKFGEPLEEVEIKTKEPVDPRVKDLQDRIKWHKDLATNVRAIKEKQIKKAELTKIAAAGDMTTMRKAVAPKPKGPKKPDPLAAINKEIADIEKYLKDKLRDIDKAQASINKERLRESIFNDLEKAIYEAIENDASNLITRGVRTTFMLRQLALLAQLPSVLAGVGTGAAGVYKDFWRIWANFSNVFTDAPKAFKYAYADAIGLAETFKVLGTGLGKAMVRSAKETKSATGGTGLSDRFGIVNKGRLPSGDAALVRAARLSAKRKADAIDNVGNILQRWVSTGNWWAILDWGIRGITAADEVFRRQLLAGRTKSASLKEAIRNNPNDLKKAKKDAIAINNAKWTDKDGLEVLSELGERADETRTVNEDLMFASNADQVEDVLEPLTDKLIRGVQSWAHSEEHPWFAGLIKTFMPFIPVGFRSARLATRAVVTPIPVLENVFVNRYTKRIKNLHAEVKDNLLLREHPNVSPEGIKDIDLKNQQIQERIERLIERRAKFNSENITDFLSNSSVMALGLYLASNTDQLIGSRSWMTYEQKERREKDEFTIFGWNYKDWLPISAPLALVADLVEWSNMKAEQEASGVKLLAKDQDFFTVMRSSLLTLIKEMPLNTGLQAAEEIITGESDIVTNKMADMVASFVPVPAEARKIRQYIASGGKMEDLRGGSFWERFTYRAFGSSTPNKKVDYFGKDLPSKRSIFQQLVFRSAPGNKLPSTAFEKILQKDAQFEIKKPSRYLSTGIEMTKFINSDGMTLQRRFDLELSTTDIEREVNKLIKDPNWIAVFKQGGIQSETNPERTINPALQELNSLMQSYYTEARDNLLNKKGELEDFISERTKDDGTPENVLDVLKITEESFGLPVGAPTSIEEIQKLQSLID